MKRIILQTFMASTVVLGLASCSDFLDADNKSNVTDKQYFSSKVGFESLVNNAYEHMRDIYATNDYADWFNAGTDMYCDGRNKINEAFQTYETLTPDNSDVKNLYRNCYAGIRAAYAVPYYAGMGTLDETLVKKRVDEARVVAANYYYILVNSFGGVPLMKDYVSTAATGYPKSSAADVYQFIISELESVIADNALEASTATKGGGRVSMEAAKALLAKTYLSAAWDLGNKDYFGKAAQYADEVINGRQLTTPFADLWKADCSNDDNAEFLWDCEYDYATANNKTSGGTSWQGLYSNYLGGSEDPIKLTSSNYIPTIYALHCFEKGDKRYDVTFMKELPDVAKGNAGKTGYYTWYTNGQSLKGYKVQRYYSAWYETADDIAAWRAEDPANRANTYVIPMDTKSKEAQQMTGADKDYYANQEFVFGSSPCKKFDDAVTMSNQNSMDYHDVHIITLSEVYLIAAEAYMKAGNNPKALERINAVRERAGLIDASSIDIESILKERACELFGNGQRYFDLRRTGTLVNHCNLYNPQLENQAQARIGEKILRPIPQAAIDANDQLTSADQNPGY